MRKTNELIEETMAYTYYTFGTVGWCKVISLESLGTDRWMTSESEQAEMRQLHENIVSLEAKVGMRDAFVEMMYNWTPEDSAYGEIQDAEWIPASPHECGLVVDEMVRLSLEFLAENREENLEFLQNMLSWNKLSSWKELEQASPEIQEKVAADLKQRYYGKDGRAKGMFEDYKGLKKIFMEELFNPEEVQYFTASIPDVKFSAAIGIDHKSVAIFWLE